MTRLSCVVPAVSLLSLTGCEEILREIADADASGCGACPAGQVCGAGGKCVAVGKDVVAGRLAFEFRAPRKTADGQIVLDQVDTSPAIGMAVDVVDSAGAVLGSTVIASEDGSFAVNLSKERAGGEVVLFTAVLAGSDGKPLLALLHPSQAGEARSMTSEPWSWSAKVPDSGDIGALTVTESQGSGSMYVYLFTLAAMSTILDDILGGDQTKLMPLAVLWTPGEAWDCGCCYASSIAQRASGGAELGQSIFIGGEESGSSAWGYPVILHEFGHYVAANYSRDDSPGGTHYVGVPVAPAFAWSEGWASFFGVMTMSRWIEEPSPLSWDIQQGSSFWLDYSSGATDSQPMTQAEPGKGMEQDLDENWVAHMLWEVWDGADCPEQGQDDGTAIGTAAVMKAVSSGRFLGADRGASGADFVDFLDSAACAQSGLTVAVTKTVEAMGFPYDGNPGCN